MRTLLAAVLAAGSLMPAAPTRQEDDQLALRAVRFYRADHRRTRVTAFLEIPHALMDSSGSIYQVTFRLSDSAGTTLHTEAWKATVPVERAPSPFVVETVEFLVTPGRYRLEATVRSGATGRESRAVVGLEGFEKRPAVSDLLLSPQIRLVAAGDTVPQPGELRRGEALVTASAMPRFGRARTTAHYLLEVYSADDREDEGTMAVSVRDSAGATTLRWRPLPVRVQPGGSTLHGHVSLAGLPPGRYTLAVAVALAGRTDERNAEFVIDGEGADEAP